MRDTVVYLGPTLDRAEAEGILTADYLPPICRGDLARLPENVRFVGIVDGEFYQSLAVSPKEVLVLLRRGVRVLGASSMGALRAAETHRYGMIGVGNVFEMYRDGVLDGDDEVALVYEPESYRSLSEPLVNLRQALTMAQDAGVISVRECEELTSRMKSTYFPDRSYRALEQLCPPLTDYFRGLALPDVKREDAIAMLVAISKMRVETSADVVFQSFPSMKGALAADSASSPRGS